MDGIRAALRDLRRAIVFTKLFHSFMNALLVFLVCTFVLLFFKVSWMYGFVIGGAYFLVRLYRDVMRTRYKDIEETVPELRWQLRTVHDNMAKENEVIHSLQQTVLQKAKEVRTSAFVDNRVTIYKLLGIFGLSFLIVFLGAFSVTFPGFKSVFPTGALAKALGQHNPLGGIEYEGAFERRSDRDIYGEERVVSLGNEELELTVTPEQNKANLHDPQDTSDLAFDQQGRLLDIGAAPDKSYEDRFKKEESKLIKNYLKKLTEYSNSERR